MSVLCRKCERLENLNFLNLLIWNIFDLILYDFFCFLNFFTSHLRHRGPLNECLLPERLEVQRASYNHLGIRQQWRTEHLWDLSMGRLVYPALNGNAIKLKTFSS